MSKSPKRPKTEHCVQESACSTQRALSKVATRGAVGLTSGVGAGIQTHGLRTKRFRAGVEEEVIVLGASCSEVFSGPQLAKVLRPAVDHQVQTLISLENDEAIQPLMIHTSVAIPQSLGPFVEALENHLPWRERTDDWWVNLQIEGATAVWAGVEALMRLRAADGVPRELIGVADQSYHGPKTTGLGMPAQRRWPGAAQAEGQISYPTIKPGEFETEAMVDDFVKRFDAFLEEHGDQIGVMVFEPQWGSSKAALCWPRHALQEVVRKTREKGILVLCDEIMCGLGRHGQGTLFLSQAFELEPDAVVFGKAVAAGVFPMSGVVVKRGAKALGHIGKGMVQCHTYAASSFLAFLTASEVIRELPQWFDHAARMGEVVNEILGPISCSQFLRIQGMGLLWGGQFIDPDAGRRLEALRLLRTACQRERVWPYFVSVGGFMITPPLDVKEADFREGLCRIRRCCEWVKGMMS